MEKVLNVKKEDKKYVFDGTDLQQVSYSREEDKLATLQEILRKFDEGYTLDIDFSLEALLVEVMSDREYVAPNWSRFRFSDPPKYTGKEIKEIRTRLKMGMQRLGYILGYSISSIDKYEKGEYKLMPWTRRRILQLIAADPSIVIRAGVAEPKEVFASRYTREAPTDIFSKWRKQRKRDRRERPIDLS